MNSVNKYYLGGFHLFIYFINDWIGCHEESYTLAPVALFCINNVYAINDAYLDGALDHLHHDSRVLWDRETLPEKYKKNTNYRETERNRKCKKSIETVVTGQLICIKGYSPTEFPRNVIFKFSLTVSFKWEKSHLHK